MAGWPSDSCKTTEFFDLGNDHLRSFGVLSMTPVTVCYYALVVLVFQLAEGEAGVIPRLVDKLIQQVDVTPNIK